MPFFRTFSGYEGYVDKSSYTENLAKAVLKKISEESFNPGQQTVAENTTFDAYVIVEWNLDYYGIFANYQSRVSSYNLRIDCPHPEAISETIDFLEKEIRDVIYSIYEQDFDYNWTEESRIEEFEEIKNDNITDLFGKVGIFI